MLVPVQEKEPRKIWEKQKYAHETIQQRQHLRIFQMSIKTWGS